jgi:hypothetical protein
MCINIFFTAPFGMYLVLPVLPIVFNLKYNFMMTTLSSVLEKLRIRKQDNEFQVSEKGFSSPAGKVYQPDELKIIKTYRFEGDSDPSDSTILYLIEANDGLTGYSIDAYGAYTNHEEDWYDDFVRKIPVSEREEQEIFP